MYTIFDADLIQATILRNKLLAQLIFSCGRREETDARSLETIEEHAKKIYDD